MSDAARPLDLQTAAGWIRWTPPPKYIKEKDRVLPDGILVHSCRQRAVDLNRGFCPVDGGAKNQDVLDPRAYRDGKVQVLHVEGVCDDQNAEGDRPLQVGLAEELSACPERKMNSAIDLERWVGELAFRDQALMERKMAGFETTQIAHDLDQPYNVTYYREKQLGHELAKRAGVSIAGRKRRTSSSNSGAARSARAIQQIQ